MTLPPDLIKFFGQDTADLPQAVSAYGSEPGALINLFNNILKISIFVSLLFAIINFLISGIQYIGSSGNPELLKQASSRIWISLLGLVVAVGSLIIAGLLGLLFFGSATAIINPVIYGPSL